MLLQLACVASFLVQSNFSFVRFGVQPSKRPSFYPTGTHAESVILLSSSSSSSSSSDPHPPEKPPPKSVLERAAYFATPEKERARRTPDKESEGDVDVEVKAQASESFPSYTPGDASRFEVNEELLEWGNKAVEHVFKPMTDVQKGVSPDRIKGAAITGAVLGLLAGNGIVAAGAGGLSAAYLAISKGVTGDVFRTVGGITWDVTDTASRLVEKLTRNERFYVMTKDLAETAMLAFQSAQKSAQYLEYERGKATSNASEVGEAEQAFLKSQEELAKVLKEAEAVIDEADEAIATARAEQKLKSKEEDEKKDIIYQEAVRREEERLAEQAKGAEEERLEKERLSEKKRHDDFRLAEEARITEEQELKGELLAEEARVAKDAKLAEETKLAEEAKLAKEARFAEETQFAMEAKLAEDARLAEETKLAEEARLAEIGSSTEEDDFFLDDDEWIAAVEMAQEGLEGKIVGIEDMIADNNAKAVWDAAGILARDLQQGSESDGDDDFEGVDFDALGKAAREAVESFESEKKVIDAAKLDQKRQWAKAMTTENIDEEETGDYSDISSEELARAAREAVEMMVNEDGNFNGLDDDGEMDQKGSVVNYASRDWSSMTVSQLRDELKSRGLMIKGKKAELIDLLEQDDAKLFSGGNVNGNGDDLGNSADFDSDFVEFDVEELGRQAREAVQVFQNQGGEFDEDPTQEMLAQLEYEMSSNDEFSADAMADFARMTVAQLKNECKSRGLKVGGKKAELIERLESSTG